VSDRLIFQLGTNNWQRDGEFVPGCGRKTNSPCSSAAPMSGASGQGPAPGYAMSLDEGRRATLRERIRSSVPIAEDGSIKLIARA
jgi:hypothetical protein